MPNLHPRIQNTFWFDHRTDLPQWLSIGIGQLIAEWSMLDKELEELIRILIDGDFQQTRILLFKVSGRTRIPIIKALIESHVLGGRLKSSEKSKFNKIQKRILAELNNRNLIAHGLFTKRGKSWKVLQTRDSRAIPELQPHIDQLARAVLPQSIKVTRVTLTACCRRTVSIAKQVEAMSKRFERKLGSSRDRPPSYTRRRPDYRRPARIP
jgi:hypothetical protein